MTLRNGVNAEPLTGSNILLHVPSTVLYRDCARQLIGVVLLHSSLVKPVIFDEEIITLFSFEMFSAVLKITTMSRHE